MLSAYSLFIGKSLVMEQTKFQRNIEVSVDKSTELDSSISLVSLEAEIPEDLYIGMKDFISDHPNFDQYGVMSSALANFLYQNGCSDRAVTEKYLNDLFTLSHA